MFIRLCGRLLPCCPSIPSIQVLSICEETQKTLRCPIWTSKSVQTANASLQSGFESHFKPSRHMVWIWFAKIRFLMDFLLFRLNKISPDTIWIWQKSYLRWQCEQGLRFSSLLVDDVCEASTFHNFLSVFVVAISFEDSISLARNNLLESSCQYSDNFRFEKKKKKEINTLWWNSCYVSLDRHESKLPL